MKNTMPGIRSFENSSALLFNNHQKNILSVREQLFSSLKKKSSTLASGAEKILDRKMKQRNNVDMPLMFELFPWIIKDLVGMSFRKTHEISVNWLAIYLYVSFLDDHLDTKTEIKPEEFLGASVLAQKGLINLFKIVNGTRYEKLFKDSLFSSASYQLADVLNQTKINPDYSEKEKSASGKNRILIACAGALAASMEKKAQFIIDITTELLLTLQFLDDLADFEDDWKYRNITVLLNAVAKEENINSENISRNDLIGKLISTGSLYHVIEKIEISLTAAIALIDANVSDNKSCNLSYQFFTSLYFDVLFLCNLLEENTNNFKNLPAKNQRQVIEKVEKAITKIYLHT